jgi:hypothetical protein
MQLGDVYAARTEMSPTKALSHITDATFTADHASRIWKPQKNIDLVAETAAATTPLLWHVHERPVLAFSHIAADDVEFAVQVEDQSQPHPPLPWC